MSAELSKDTLEQITGWLQRLWPEAEVWRWAVEELLREVFFNYPARSLDDYIHEVSGVVPDMAGRLESLEQVLDNEFCRIWQVIWDLGRGVGGRHIIGHEVLVYHVADNTVAWYATDTGNGIPVSEQVKLPPGRQFHVYDIVAAWLAASAEGWSCCVE